MYTALHSAISNAHKKKPVVCKKRTVVRVTTAHHSNDPCVKQLPTAHHSNEPSNETEVQQMVRIDAGCRIDLQAVVTVAGVLEQAVHRIEHIMGQVEEPLPGQ